MLILDNTIKTKNNKKNKNPERVFLFIILLNNMLLSFVQFQYSTI